MASETWRMNTTHMRKGTNVKPTEQSAQKPSTKTGLFALLGAFSCVKGSGAPKVARARLATVAMLATTLGLLMVAVPAADAGTGYGLSFSFGSPEGFAGPVGLMVDNSGDSSKGDVYVVDQGHNFLDEFNAKGEIQEGFGTKGQVELAGAQPNQGTVDDYAGADQGDVYVAGNGDGVVYRVTAAGAVTEVLTGLGEPRGVAVDAAGDFFVTDGGGEVLEYNAKWEPITAAGLPPGMGESNTVVSGLPSPQTLAVSANGDDIYIATEGGTFQAALVAGSYVSATFDANGSTSVTIAPSGDVFVDQGNEVAFYEPSGTLLGTFGGGVLSGGAYGVGVSGTHAYVADNAAGQVDAFEEGPTPETPETTAASDVQGTSAILHAKLKLGGGETKLKYYFEYNTGGSCTAGTKTPVKEGAGEVAEEVTGLALGTQYTFCVYAQNPVGEATGSPVTFETSIVGETFATGVTATEATLDAEIGPGGAVASYHAEYGTSSVTESSTPEAHTLASSTPVQVQATLSGLQPATTYHYRFVANNGNGTVVGEEHSFITPAAGSETPQNCPNEQRRTEQPYGLGLPDCRAYEIVSPAETNGNDATDPIGDSGHIRVSEDKEKEEKGEEEAPAITYSSRGSFAEPHGATFENQLLSRREPEHDRWNTRSVTAPWKGDGADEAPTGYDGVFFTPELTEGLTSTEDALTSGSEAAPEGLEQLYLVDLTGASQSYRLISHLPPSEEIYGPGYGEASVYPLGASNDLSHVVFITTEPENNTVGPLREWVNGRVVLVGVSNKGEPWTGATVGSSGTTTSEAESPYVWRAVSEDGSRVIFNYGGALYARVNAGVKVEPEPEREQSKMNGEECLEPAKACTVKLSAGAKYWGANTEDTKIFYTENGDLYEYELPLGSVKGKATAFTHSGEVQGVVQISEDGSYVYFVAKDDLYVSDEGGTPVFIAALSPGDKSDWSEGPGANSAVLAPGGGSQLAFTSENSLTGYENRDALSGTPDKEVYLFDAETSALVCASCNPSGARPLGPASLAIGSYGGRGASDYRPRDLLADGSLFFDSKDALVPHASDGRQNVYEYEDGHVYAISNVAGGQESFFLDASPSGQDVFFGSSDKLLPEDTGNNVVVWDAREGGGFPVTVAPQACTTAEACRAASPPTPGVFGAPPSATFSGPGNITPPPPAVVKPKPKSLTRAQKLAAALKACKKDRSKVKRATCEKQAKQKYGAKKLAKKAGNKRRAK